MKSSISRIKKAIKKLNPSFTIKEEKGCVILNGESTSWDEIVEAGKLAVSKDHYGVLNDIVLKGFIDKQILPAVKDNLLDGLKCDVLVIGGGIVGAATIRALSKYKLNIVLVEKGQDLCLGQSGRNGGVVHVGIDMKKHPIKASYCIRGNKMYDKLTSDLEVPFEHKGQVVLIKDPFEKIIVPVMKNWAKSLGITGVKYYGKKELKRIEPEIPSWAIGGVFMPSGGIVNPFKMTISLAENAITNGAKVYLDTAVLAMKMKDDMVESVQTNRGTIFPKVVINCAGIYADKIAEMAKDRTFTIHPRKGSDIILDEKMGFIVKTSFSKSPLTDLSKISGDKNNLKGLSGFEAYQKKHVSKGLGTIHSVDGNALIGPDAIETPYREDYSTEKSSFDHIIKEQSLVSPKVKKSDVIAYFAGTRAATYEEDFVVRKGIFTKNIMEAAGIQSPGLTAAPAIAEDLSKWTIEYLGTLMKVEENKTYSPHHKGAFSLKDLPLSLRDKLIKVNPDYGEIICRCEEISKGEIIDCLRSPLPVYSLDAVKRRIRPGMGRCQGAFCSPLVLQIIAKEKKVEVEDIKKNSNESTILYGKIKEGKND